MENIFAPKKWNYFLFIGEFIILADKGNDFGLFTQE